MAFDQVEFEKAMRGAGIKHPNGRRPERGLALKARWVVHAGLTPTILDPNYCRSWEMSGDEWDLGGPAGQELFLELMEDAHAYARFLSLPQYFNYVALEWLWL